MMNISPKKGYGYIYKYTSPSGKSYVGQTKVSLSDRAGSNGIDYKKCPVFYNAIKKYGYKNFDVEILAEVKIEELDDAEKKYIHLFNTMIPNGYNVDEGGHSNTVQVKTFYQYDLEGNFLKEYTNVKETSQELGLNYQTLLACLDGYTHSCGGYCWSYVKMKKFPIHEEMLNNIKKQVEMYDLNDNLIMVFPSITQAAEYCNGRRDSIRKACRGELKTAHGYKWRCSEIIAEKKYNNTAKSIMKLDKDTNEVIEVFPSISAAARSLGKRTSLIRRVLNNDTLTAYGFKWKTAQGSTTKCS